MVVYRAPAQEAPSTAPANLQSQDGQVHRSWEVGGFVEGGFPPSYEVSSGGLQYHRTLELYNAGFESGRMLTALHGPSLLHGRGEAVVEVIPFWLAYYPKQEVLVNSTLSTYSGLIGFEALRSPGVSVTPLLFRWNFMNRASNRLVPWVQLGSGLLWTAHNFPQGGGQGYGTSRINFTPQVSVGESIFTRNNQSLNLAVKAVHISSAGLGEYNPGISVNLQFRLGYSWWK
jgi:hypothetical protein